MNRPQRNAQPLDRLGDADRNELTSASINSDAIRAANPANLRGNIRFLAEAGTDATQLREVERPAPKREHQLLGGEIFGNRIERELEERVPHVGAVLDHQACGHQRLNLVELEALVTDRKS